MQTGRRQYINCKTMAINALVAQMCEEERVGFVGKLYWERKHARERWPSSKWKTVFSEKLLRSMDSGTGCKYLN